MSSVDVKSIRSGNTLLSVQQEKIHNKRGRDNSYFPDRLSSNLPTQLSPHLIRLIVSSNLYTEDKVRIWFQKFLHDCPTGFVDRQKLLIVFRHFYNEKKASQLTDNVFNAVGCTIMNQLDKHAHNTDYESTTSSDNLGTSIMDRAKNPPGGSAYRDERLLDFSRYILAFSLICEGNVDDKLNIVTSLYIYNKNVVELGDAISIMDGDDILINQSVTIHREDAVRILESIAILLGVKRYHPSSQTIVTTDEQVSDSSSAQLTPYRKRVDKIFDSLGQNELSQQVFVQKFSVDSLVKGLLTTRF